LQPWPLVHGGGTRHKPFMVVPEIFDRRLRRARRDRAAGGFADHAFLLDYMIEGLLDRLDVVTRPFSHALDLGCHDGRLTRSLAARSINVVPCDAGLNFATMAAGIQCDEDRLSFADHSFDLVMSAGVLDQVNDLPGALTLIRRALKPDGLFLGCFVGAGSLSKLRKGLMEADLALGTGVGSHMHPMIDVRAGGDLLGRAGFVLTVADVEPLKVRYSHLLDLIHDLRGMAMTNLLAERSAPAFGKRRLAALIDAFGKQADPDGKVTETFELIYLTGWAPGPNQPQPAKRGSGRQSLAHSLRPSIK